MDPIWSPAAEPSPDPAPGAGTPSIAQLRAFVAVSRRLHFGSAAAVLGVSQPALSQALAGLERMLGRTLVERTTRSALLTADGEALVAPAEAVLDAVDAFRLASQADRAPLAGPLRLGVIPTVAPYLLPSALRAFRRHLPALVPIIREDQTARVLAAVQVGALDVGILALPGGEPGMRELPLYAEDFLLVVPRKHPWAGRTDIAAAQLNDAELLLLDEGHCLRDQALDVCRQAGVRAPASTAARSASLATVVQLVAGGLGITLVPASAAPAEVGRGALALAEFADPAPGRVIGLVHRAADPRRDDFDALATVLRTAVTQARLGVRPTA